MDDAEKLKASWEKLRKAAEDLRYLLDRGYAKESATDFVANRYVLDKTMRSVLYRAVLSGEKAKLIRSKAAKPEELRGSRILVDGFNVLNTLQALADGRPLILCCDGVVRDVSEAHAGYRFTEKTLRAIETAVEALEQLSVKEAYFYYETQISRSGEIAAATRKTLDAKGLSGTAETERSVDARLVQERGIVATSDSALILRTERFFDLAGYVAKREKPQNIITLSV